MRNLRINWGFYRELHAGLFLFSDFLLTTEKTKWWPHVWIMMLFSIIMYFLINKWHVYCICSIRVMQNVITSLTGKQQSQLGNLGKGLKIFYKWLQKVCQDPGKAFRTVICDFIAWPPLKKPHKLLFLYFSFSVFGCIKQKKTSLFNRQMRRLYEDDATLVCIHQINIFVCQLRILFIFMTLLYSLRRSSHVSSRTHNRMT